MSDSPITDDKIAGTHILSLCDEIERLRGLFVNDVAWDTIEDQRAIIDAMRPVVDALLEVEKEGPIQGCGCLSCERLYEPLNKALDAYHKTQAPQ